MAHDVFISYSHHDKAVADAACSTLENQGIRCWIAPRDVTPGLDWSAEIIEAISNCQLMVLIYSEHSNESNQIKREVERAVNRGIIIVPFRIQDVPMSKALEYFISSPHWMDAITPPLEKHLNYLAQTVKLLLSRNKKTDPEIAPSKGAAAGNAGQAKFPASGTGRYLSFRNIVVATAVLLVVLVMIFFVSKSGGGFDTTWYGKWSVSGPYLNGTNTATISVGANREISTSFVYKEAGSATLSKVAAGGKLRLIPTNGKYTDNTYTVLNDNSISISGQEGTATWIRQPGSQGIPPLGEWVLNTNINGLPTTLQLFIQQGSYQLISTARDHGVLEAQGGHWSIVSDITGITSSGTYSFLDNQHVSMTGPLGTAVWIRQ